MPSGPDMNKAQQEEQVARIARLSHTIRQAVRAAIPAPPEQFLTLMIPGKVIDFEKFCDGFDANGKLTEAVLPNSVQLNEALLCDDMPALSGIQLGPTGRSVSRSYAATLSKLCPSGSTTGISDEVPEGELSAAEKRYQHAMSYLTGKDPNCPTMSRVEMYREKQKKYSEEFSNKTKAFNAALKDAAKEHPTSPPLQRIAYDKWVSENYKTFNNLVQAAYMDWVTMGKKEEVEYYFAIVDNDSAMSRVEASKECMRAAVISDTDGSTEFQKVKLEPQNWAWLAKKKASAGPKAETVQTLTYKISRLQQVNLLLEGMIRKPEYVKPVAETPPTVPKPNGEQEVENFLQAQKEFQEASAAYDKLIKGNPENKPDKSEVTKKGDALSLKRAALATHFKGLEKDNIAKLTQIAQDAQNKLFEESCDLIKKQVADNNALITEYSARCDTLRMGSGHDSKTTATGLQNNFADKAGIARDAPAPAPNADGKDDSDYWTSISVEVSSSYSHEETETNANTFSAGGAAGWGLWTVGAAASHSSSSSDASKQMANSSINVSFECMRVDVTRTWLRGELFYDHELRVAPNEHISPGPVKLSELMDPTKQMIMSDSAKLAREKELEKYDLFPMYPTSFLLAANVVLEIEGETSDIQQHFSTSSSGGSASVGWGPFAVTAGGSRSKTKTDATCEATASGCRITIKSPQVIGWISQIVPALPRLNDKAV